jgi:hypothetical protein
MNEMRTIGDDFPRMQQQVREMREHGRAIGPAGAFYVAVCDDLLTRAEQAASSGDIVRMIAIYKEMKELQ